MKARQLIETLESLLDQPWAVFLWGPPGVGKSAVVRSVAEKHGLPVLDLRASLLDPTDLRGIPAVQNGEAIWCPPSFLPKPEDKPGILFLDEINAAPPIVQASMYQLVLDRRVGEYVLPDGWKLIAAGNRREDRAVTYRLSTALANRFIHLTLEADAASWVSWAESAGIHPAVCNFIRIRPALIWHATDEETAFASPRSWAMASDVLRLVRKKQALKETLGGIIGRGPAAEFMAFLASSLSEAELEALLDDPAHVQLPTEPDRLWMLISWLIARSDDEKILKAAGVLASRLPAEIAFVMVRGIGRRRSDFLRMPPAAAFLKTEGRRLLQECA